MADLLHEFRIKSSTYQTVNIIRLRCFNPRCLEFFFTVKSLDAKYYVVSAIDNIVNPQTNNTLILLL
jgi:hypothetical protein